jgi:hypothetical protein
MHGGALGGGFSPAPAPIPLARAARQFVSAPDRLVFISLRVGFSSRAFASRCFCLLPFVASPCFVVTKPLCSISHRVSSHLSLYFTH